jgi:glycosyltransferase involved in cell wall biosynthesis
LGKIRIIFTSDDFKTRHWGKELEKFGCEIILNPTDRLTYLNTILRFARPLIRQYLLRKKIDVFIFRYLNDSKHLRVSLEFLLRDILTIILCKLINVRMIWLLHNIDKETIEHFPGITKIRRALVKLASSRVLVTDPLLIDYAVQYGIKRERVDWICFGRPVYGSPDLRNIRLHQQISDFKNTLRSRGMKNIITGLCVSAKADKKAHYLHADTIVGRCSHQGETCVILVLIGDFPEGGDFADAKKRAMESPWILLIEETFPVNESYIADQIDFFYRSMTDWSVAYSLYVASDQKKPVITHRHGALSDIVEKESIGYVIDDSETDIPAYIARSLSTWDHQPAFLDIRSWETGAQRLNSTILKTGVKQF